LNTAKPGEPYTGAQSCIAVHAEANALIHGDATRYRGGTIYVVSIGPDGKLHESQAPCDGCANLIAGGGVVRTVTPDTLGLRSVLLTLG
jgi:dCMP deaminase